MKEHTTAQRLKQIMDDRRLKQVDILKLSEPFCAKYGVKLNKSDLSQYVSGKVVPGQDKLTVLGLALNVSEAWLMGYDVEMQREEKAVAPNGKGLCDLLLKISELDIATITTILSLDVEEKEKALSYCHYLAENGKGHHG